VAVIRQSLDGGSKLRQLPEAIMKKSLLNFQQAFFTF
jgi:hypothetical protein